MILLLLVSCTRNFLYSDTAIMAAANLLMLPLPAAAQLGPLGDCCLTAMRS